MDLRLSFAKARCTGSTLVSLGAASLHEQRRRIHVNEMTVSLYRLIITIEIKNVFQVSEVACVGCRDNLPTTRRPNELNSVT